MKDDEPQTGFSPSDTTDHRGQYDWRSRYPDLDAKIGIRIDAGYLGAVLALVVAGFFFVMFSKPNASPHIVDSRIQIVQIYGCAWLGGTLGGTLFALKWLYHSVAKGWWNEDRHLWRFFTPHISGGLSFAVVALISSGLIRAFDASAIRSSLATVVGISFLIGYFSDSAIAKLSELADTLFGVVRPARRKELPRDPTQGTKP